jgi:hypothetical protein
VVSWIGRVGVVRRVQGMVDVVGDVRAWGPFSFSLPLCLCLFSLSLKLGPKYVGLVVSERRVLKA